MAAEDREGVHFFMLDIGRNEYMGTAHAYRACELRAEYLFVAIRKNLPPSPFLWEVDVKVEGMKDGEDER
jgi:hypothetical protein